jgi:hypothetical protein
VLEVFEKAQAYIIVPQQFVKFNKAIGFTRVVSRGQPFLPALIMVMFGVSEVDFRGTECILAVEEQSIGLWSYC